MVQGYALVEQENARLRGLMKLEARVPVTATAAEVLYSSRDPFTQKLFVDKGEAAGVQAGRAVIDSIGVVGQVTRVFPYMAEVTLITDKDHAVPVKVERSGVRTVMYGAGAARPPELRYLSPSVEIEPGDLLVTSGIDGTYPAGLAVAQVVSVERETGQSFAHVTCKPLAGDRQQRAGADPRIDRGGAAAPRGACRHRKRRARAAAGAKAERPRCRLSSPPALRKSCCRSGRGSSS